MKSRQFFIKEGYVHRDIAFTSDSISQAEYWDSARQRTSFYHQRPVYSFAIRLMSARKMRTIVDVGCGVGTKLAMVQRALPHVEIIGIDQAMPIKICRERYGFGRWYVDDFERPDEALLDIRGDLVICADVIEHMLDPDVLLGYLKRRASQSGLILLSTPDRDRLRGKECMQSPNHCHVREWSFGELHEYLSYSGFEVVDHFRQFAVSPGWNRAVLADLFKALMPGRSLRYNQVCLLRVR